MDGSGNGLLPPAAYVNFLRVAHQATEFYLSFGQVAQGQAASAHLVSSLVTSPAHAKSMLQALSEAIARYEERFGAIPVVEPPAASDSAAAAGS